MSKRSRILLAIIGLIGLGVLAFWPSTWHPRALANITLISFTAELVPNQPKVLIKWETGTEFNTAGFFIRRRESAAGAFVRISDLIPSANNQTGAAYDFLDENTTLNQTYSYRLEEITTDQQSNFYDPITITVVIPATVTPTPTSTPTPTITPTATAKVKVTASRTRASFATPQLATGSTVTPRPTVGNIVATNPAPTTAPLVFNTATTVPANNIVPQPVSVIATPVPAVSSGSIGNQVTLVPTSIIVAQVPEPPLASAAGAQAQVAPVVVVTEAGPSSTAEDSAGITIPLLLIAAIVLLGGGLVILLQARK